MSCFNPGNSQDTVFSQKDAIIEYWKNPLNKEARNLIDDYVWQCVDHLCLGYAPNRDFLTNGADLAYRLAKAKQEDLSPYKRMARFSDLQTLLDGHEPGKLPPYLAYQPASTSNPVSDGGSALVAVGLSAAQRRQIEGDATEDEDVLANKVCPPNRLKGLKSNTDDDVDGDGSGSIGGIRSNGPYGSDVGNQYHSSSLIADFDDLENYDSGSSCSEGGFKIVPGYIEAIN